MHVVLRQASVSGAPITNSKYVAHKSRLTNRGMAIADRWVVRGLTLSELAGTLAMLFLLGTHWGAWSFVEVKIALLTIFFIVLASVVCSFLLEKPHALSILLWFQVVIAGMCFLLAIQFCVKVKTPKNGDEEFFYTNYQGVICSSLSFDLMVMVAAVVDVFFVDRMKTATCKATARTETPSANPPALSLGHVEEIDLA